MRRELVGTGAATFNPSVDSRRPETAGVLARSCTSSPGPSNARQHRKDRRTVARGPAACCDDSLGAEVQPWPGGTYRALAGVAAAVVCGAIAGRAEGVGPLPESGRHDRGIGPRSRSAIA